MNRYDFSGSPVSDAYVRWASENRDPEKGEPRLPEGARKPASTRNHTDALLRIAARPAKGSAGR